MVRRAELRSTRFAADLTAPANGRSVGAADRWQEPPAGDFPPGTGDPYFGFCRGKGVPLPGFPREQKMPTGAAAAVFFISRDIRHN
jgi:hypothetical protein